MSATKVTLRKRELPSGKITLYLDFWPPVRNPRTGLESRREYLGIYLKKDPKGKIERSNNAEKLKIAEAIRSEREIAILKEQFGFADRTRGRIDFFNYFEKIANEPGSNVMGTFKHFRKFTGGHCTVADVNYDLCERFKAYLLAPDCTLDGRQFVSQNTAANYWIFFVSVLKRAQKEKILLDDVVSRLEGIPFKAIHKEYLTLEEVRKLAATPCGNSQVKRAGLLSCLCGLRISDIEQLTWDNVKIYPDGGYALDVRTQKTDTVALIPINEEAFALLGEKKEGRIFDGFSRTTLSKYLKKWVADAGITKPVTFHTFRHTYATLLTSKGTSIYTVSKLLTHANVATTQIYADIMDEDKRKAAESINIGVDIDLTDKPKNKGGRPRKNPVEPKTK